MLKTTNKYFTFLRNLINKQYESEHSILLKELYRTEFYSTVPNDDNRGEDGLYLRGLFLDEEGPQALSHLPKNNSECSMLEMLIGLSNRLEFELAQSRFEKTTAEWFWVLIDNLNLMCATDVEIKNNRQVFLDSQAKIQRMLKRRYNSNGEGGLFPLKNPKHDQRQVEIWYQMSEYILENYPIM